jgi:hypothetical protein
MLRARATTIGSWERFFFPTDLLEDSHPYYTVLWAANARYVSAELEYAAGNYAMLRARARSVLGSFPGTWEQFYFIPIG